MNEAGFEKDKESGLLLPPGTREKVKERWSYQGEIKHLKRTKKALDERHIGIMLVCEDCEKPIIFSAAADSLTGMKMECECKERTVVD